MVRGVSAIVRKVRRDRPHLRQGPPTELLAQHRQLLPLGVSEPQPLLPEPPSRAQFTVFRYST